MAKHVAEKLLTRLSAVVAAEGSSLIDADWLKEVQGFAKVASSNYVQALSLKTSAMLKIKGKEGIKKKAGDEAQEALPRRAFVYPCDDPLVKANPVLNFDYELCSLYPEVIPLL